MFYSSKNRGNMGRFYHFRSRSVSTAQTPSSGSPKVNCTGLGIGTWGLIGTWSLGAWNLLKMDRFLSRTEIAVILLYLFSGLVHTTIAPGAFDGLVHLRIGPLVLAPPLVLSGDSPHYLVSVNSLVEDGDFDLANNYQQAEQGDWDLGARFRGVQIDHHADRDRLGRERGTHSPFFALLLAAVTWPFRGTAWVEPICIWMTQIVTLAGLLLLGRRWSLGSPWLLALALATPLWCYSRDLWTEPWVTSIWIVMLHCRGPAAASLLGFLGALLKYPFAVVPIAMGCVAIWEKRLKDGCALIASGALALIVTVLSVGYLFREVDHFSFFHSGSHLGFDWPFDGTLGLLLSPSKGILWFFPFLAWGLWELRRRKSISIYVPLMAFFLLHAFYEEWQAGTGLAGRYLVPTLPLLVMAVARSLPQGVLFRASLVWSALWGMLAGLLPALVQDRNPWQVVTHVVDKLFP